jgi:hypothetical protein
MQLLVDDMQRRLRTGEEGGGTAIAPHVQPGAGATRPHLYPPPPPTPRPMPAAPSPMPQPATPLGPAASQPGAIQATGHTAPWRPVTPQAPTPPPQSATPAGTAPLTGGEVPYSVLPGRSPDLQALLSKTMGAAGQALDNPSAYDGDVWQGMLKEGKQALDADMAGRGMYDSTAASELYGKRVLFPAMRERALTLAGDRQQSLQGALQAAGLARGVEGGERDELRGERAYNDGLRREARGDAIEDVMLEEQLQRGRNSDWNEYLRMALGLSDPGQALSALGMAGAGMGQVGSGYAQHGEGAGDLLGELARILGGSR